MFTSIFYAFKNKILFMFHGKNLYIYTSPLLKILGWVYYIYMLLITYVLFFTIVGCCKL